MGYYDVAAFRTIDDTHGFGVHLFNELSSEWEITAWEKHMEIGPKLRQDINVDLRPESLEQLAAIVIDLNRSVMEIKSSGD